MKTMENRINALFKTKRENILSIFLTAGYPNLMDTLPIINILNKTKVDMLEIGIPFSDPIADGPIIQQSSMVALNNGLTLKLIFEQLQTLRTITELPILLMGYLNSVMQYGVESFYKSCYEVGIDGVILPDLPLIEYETFHKPFADKYNIHVVFVVSPETPIERIQLIDEKSSGFIYLVSSNSTTGNFKIKENQLSDSLKSITTLKLKNPILIGFGIKGAAEFKDACAISQGAIIGSSFVNLLSNSKDLETDIPNFISNVVNIKKLER